MTPQQLKEAAEKEFPIMTEEEFYKEERGPDWRYVDYKADRMLLQKAFVAGAQYASSLSGNGGVEEVERGITIINAGLPVPCPGVSWWINAIQENPKYRDIYYTKCYRKIHGIEGGVYKIAQIFDPVDGWSEESKVLLDTYVVIQWLDESLQVEGVGDKK